MGTVCAVCVTKETEQSKKHKKDLKRKGDHDEMVVELLGLPGSINIMRNKEEQRIERKLSDRRCSVINRRKDFTLTRTNTFAKPNLKKGELIKAFKGIYDHKEKLYVSGMPYYEKLRLEDASPRAKV